MSQILNIFQKDARHHWPEILVFIALLTTFVTEQPHKWTGHPYGVRLMNILVDWLPEAMILASCFFIIRLIQSESLVGDRQFWITRPYRWHMLLGAKLLSIAVFIHVPLFISQVVLLRMARFPVSSSIPGVLFVHLLFLIAIVLPPLVVGTTTSGIGQAALVGLGAVLGLIGLAAILFMKLNMDTAADATDWVVEPLYLCAAAAVVLIQYIYRRARLAWLIIGGTLVAVALIMLLTPYEKIISGWFPPPTNTHPVPAHFKFDRMLSFAHPNDWSPAPYENELELELPFEISDLDSKSLIDVRAIKLDLELPDGTYWTSRWHAVFNHNLSYTRSRSWPDIEIQRAVFNRAKDAAVKARVTLGMNVFRLDDAGQIVMPDDRLSLPGGARCLNDLAESRLHCFSALREPGSIYLFADLPNSECPVAKDATREPWAPSPAFFADFDSSSTPDLNFSPIQQFDVNLSRYFILEDHQTKLPVCPGTHLFVSKPRFLYSVREEIDLGEIRLASYHPTFPRTIIPRVERPPQATSDSLSQNFTPEVVPAKTGVAED